MEIKLKIIKENLLRVLYKIDQSEIIINSKIFKIDKSTANLSNYLNKNNYNLLELLNNSIDNKCICCSDSVVDNRFERKTFITYKFCKKCIIEKKYKKFKIKRCSICGKEIYKKDMINNTCGLDICLDNKRNDINKSIKDTHWTKNLNKEEIYKKRSKTRLSKDLELNRKYVAWNKGKTNIYSKETIEKIRNATINQMKNGRIKKTSIEKKIENFLVENNINYKFSFILKKRQYDFILNDYNLIIEADGDYWHANPKFWDVDKNDNSKKQLYETQKMKIVDDKVKNRIAFENNYTLFRFWEDDINNNFDNIKNKILNFIKKIKN